MTVWVADAHAHGQRLVSVIKTETALEEYTTEDQSSVLRFLLAKRLNAKDIHKKCFLFTVGSVCRVKLGGTHFADDEGFVTEVQK
jgi:hypothetical protein